MKKHRHDITCALPSLYGRITVLDWMETAAPAGKLRVRHNCRNDLYSAASVHFSADGVHWPAAAATSQEALDVNCGRRRAPASLLAPCGLVAFAPFGSMVSHSAGSA